MKFQVILEEEPTLVNSLVDGVRAHIHEQLGCETTLPLLVIARDDNGELMGGVSGRTIHKKFLIQTVWVDKKYRGTGLGSQLMGLAEVEAKARGCLISQVETLSIQAPEFYQKLGFEIIGIAPEFSGSPAHYFLIKTFT